MRSEIDDILRSYSIEAYGTDDAITAILSLIESKLPKEKVIGKDASTESGVGHWLLNQSARGWNDCLAEVKKQLEIG